MRKPLLLLSVLALSAFGFAACGGDDEDEGADTGAVTTEETAPAGGAGGGEAVSVSADPGGSLAFEQESLDAPAGSVTFAFDNPASLEHDFCIEDEGGDLGCTDRITQSSSELMADLEPGTYTFYCSVPGHREGGMEGELTVQ
jgi:uncharacterized cupredoxin-like copper-binding protein